jgi:hypothetical protein
MAVLKGGRFRIGYGFPAWWRHSNGRATNPRQFQGVRYTAITSKLQCPLSLQEAWRIRRCGNKEVSH